MQYVERALNPDHAQAMLDGLAEGVVLANQVTIDCDPDAFPCCCGCGDYKLVPMRAQPLATAVRNMEVQGPQQLYRTKMGTAFDLACFQCAQRRREGDTEAHVECSVDSDGFLRCVVVRSAGADEDMIKYTPKSECEGDACGCG